MTLNIPINKGNYALETPEREALFEQYRGEGWEEEYADYRNNWTDYPKSLYVSDYPLLVDIELSTLCNLRCPMCYTITDEFKQKVNAKFMEFELFTKIIDEIHPHVPAIRLSLRGEPTIHPRFVECIEYAKQHGIKEVSFLTNGSTLIPESFARIMEAGADWITISVDGLGKVYEEIRKPLIFAETLGKIKQIQEIKLAAGRNRPVIKVQGIWPSIKEDPQAFYNTFASHVDQVAFNPLIDYLGKDSEIAYEQDFICCQHYQRLVVGADGRVMMCSNDEESSVVVGDATSETIHAIWHGELLSNYRAIHRQMDGFKQIPLCRKCYLPRETDENETAMVNGRKVVIRNYVNRSQSIGS
jgi:radical SAM protein with 4Fe4S-binding SPASM domain